MDFDKILLINPYPEIPEKYKKYKKIVPLVVPLGLGYLKAFLNTKGIESKLFDEQLEPLKSNQLENFIKNEGFGVIGISCTTLYINRALEIAKEAKKISKDIKVVLGGVHPTVMPEECLKNENVDIVVRKEGELTLWEYLKSFDGGLSLSEIDGISYRQSGAIIHNQDRKLIEDLDSLPQFPFALFREHKDRYRFNVLTSRGCPYYCIFCSARSVSGHKYRYRSAQSVVEDITFLVETYNQKRISFVDDTFTANKKRAIALCEMIISKGLHKKATFYCNVRGDTINGEILNAMKAAGFRGISLGMETASNRIMKLIEKGESVEDNIRAVKLAKEEGFHVRGSFILGLPTESNKESLETIKLAQRLPLDYAMFSVAIPFPGTRLYDIASLEGFKAPDFSKYDVMGGLSGKEAIYTPKGRSSKELMKLQRKAYFRFYFRISKIIKILKGGLPDVRIKDLGFIGSFSLIMKMLTGRIHID